MRVSAWMFSLFLLVILACGKIVAQTQDSESLFEEGNRLYLQQHYDSAAAKYESILNSGYENGELYFNLGNAYFKSGRIQNAILNYERAKRLLQDDDDLQFNLQLANLKLIDKVDPIPELFIYRWLDSLLRMFSIRTLLWLVYILFLAVLSLFSLFLFARTYEQKRYSLLGGIICSLFLLLGIANLLVQSYRESNTEYAIIMADVANIKSAPDSKGNDLFVIHRGFKVQVLDNVNRWKKIRIGDGKIGWIPDNDIEVI